MTSAQRQRIIDQITQLESQLETVNTVYTNTITEIERYSFESGGASQSVSRRKITELSVEQERLQSKIEALYRRIEGGGLCSTNLRRHD